MRAWELKRRVNPGTVLSVEARIDVESPEYLKCVTIGSELHVMVIWVVFLTRFDWVVAFVFLYVVLV